MKIIKKLLSSFMIIVMMQNIIVCNTWAEESSGSEGYEQIDETGGMPEDMGEAAENSDISDDINNDADEGSNEEENDTVIIEENTENEEETSDEREENENTTEYISETETENITEATEAETEDVAVTEETEAETNEAASEETAAEDTEAQETEVSTENDVTDSEGSSGGSSGNSDKNSNSEIEEKVEITSEENTTEVSTESLFNSLASPSKPGETSHKVELELNGGSLNDDEWEGNSKVVVTGGSVILPVPVQTGAVFKGWSQTVNGTAEYSGGEEIRNITSNRKFYAVWEWEKYTVKFALNADDTEYMWEVQIEYGYELWLDRSMTPWTDVPEEDWEISDDEETYTATVGFEFEDEPPVYVVVTKRISKYNAGGEEKEFTYYTFEYENTKWFTAAEGIIPEKEGFTFRDWYMTEPEAGGSGITADTLYIARYLDTGGYIANVNYKYVNKKTAADSTSVVLNYNSEGGNTIIDEFELRAPVLEGFHPVIKSSSVNGIELKGADGNLHEIPVSGLDFYTEMKEDESVSEYVYKIKIDMEKASFTTPEGNIIEDEEARIHCITFNIEYNPDPVGYRVNYFREVLGSDPTQHSGEYELYEYVEVKYDADNEKWIRTEYEPAWQAQLENVKYEINESIVYYRYTGYTPVSQILIAGDEGGYYNGDIIIPEKREYSNDNGVTEYEDYRGFIMGEGSLELAEEGVELKAGSNNINLFYSREDYHIYYITDSENAGMENDLFVYGADIPAPGTVTRTGYALDTSKGSSGWIYYTEIPQNNTDNSSILYNGTGYKPDTMPDMDIFAKAQWTESDTTYTVNVWLESANNTDYVKEFQFAMEAKTGDIIYTDSIISEMEYGRGDIADKINEYVLSDGTTFGLGMGKHFTFNSNYTGLGNGEEITVESDGSTEVNIMFDRKWYVLEMILGRSSANWWGQTTYQVSTETGGGTFADVTWSNANKMPVIGYDPDVIDAVDCGDYVYYKLKNGPYSTTYNYSDGTRRYLGAYGLFTDKYSITAGGTDYTVSVYYIYAKYGADIGDLWPANGNSVYVDGTGISQKYISMGTNINSEYRATSNGNANILNVYSTMSDQILNHKNGGILDNGRGFQPDTNVDDKDESEPNAVMRDADVNHHMVAYWNSANTNYYYRLLEALDGTVTDGDIDYTVDNNSVGGTGGGSNIDITSLNEGDVVKWNNRYYIVTGEPMEQLTSNTIQNQTQPALQGFESMGKAYNSSRRNLYFFYNRERYDIDLYNVSGSYKPPVSVLDERIETEDGTETTLREKGFEMTNIENVNGVECGTLKVKYGTDCTCLKYVTDYLTGFADDDDLDNRLGLKYANPTRGSKEWTFGDWYQGSSYQTKAWDTAFCKFAYCNFVLYSKWTPPNYSMRIHLGRGDYTQADHIDGYIWRNADTPSDKYAERYRGENEVVYIAEADEGEIIYVPYQPEAQGYKFAGWYYFNENEEHTHSENCKVYLKDIIDRSDLRVYKEGYIYIDYFGRARLIEEDEEGLYYCNDVRGLRYIFGESSPIYGETDIYASYENHDAEEYYVKHIIEKSQLDDSEIEKPEGWEEVTINGTVYYQFKEDYFGRRKTDQTYAAEAEYGVHITDSGGAVHYMFPDIDSQEVTMTNSLYQKAENPSANEYEYDGEENIFYTEEYSDEGNSYTYYVLFKYSILSELPYRVWYVDIDEARRIGELTDENGDHPYYTRYETPVEKDNIFLLPSEVKEINLEITGDDVLVTETARDIRGYTVIGEWQNDINLLSNGEYNNIYFYYRKQGNNATYNIKYHIMDSSNEYSSHKSIEIRYMPGVSGSDVRAEFLARYYEKYISDALSADTEIDGNLPQITVTDGSNSYYWNAEGQTDSDNIKDICMEMLKGTVNDADLSTPYIMVAANENDKVIDVYMRFGSVKLIKYNDEGERLEGASFTLTQFDAEGNKTGNVYTGVTDGNGEYVFYNLWIDESYTYELVETTAPGENYQLLKEPINISLPFTSGETLNNEYDYEEEGTYYWYDINCEITDSVKFDLPITGGKFNMGMMGTGVGMIFIAVMLMLALNKNKSGNERNGKNIKTIITKKFNFKERGATMKNSRLKRFLAALCSMVMLFSVFTVSAGAESVFDGTEQGSITITKRDTGNQNFVSGVMFRTVKVADMVQHADSTQEGVTTTSLKFKLTADGESILGSSMSGGVTSDEDTLYSSAEMRNGLETLIENCGDSSKYTSIVTSVTNAAGSLNDTTDTNAGQLTFSDLSLGVYLVVEDLENSVPLINGTGEAVTINKASAPFLVTVPQTSDNGESWEYNVDVTPKNIVNSGEAEKTVTGTADGTDGASGTTHTSTVGDTITYTVSSKILVTTDDTAYEKFELKDTAGAGISYDNFAVNSNFITVKLGESITLTENTDYTLNIDEENNSFTLTFTQAGLDKLNEVTADTTITFTYTGSLNENAVNGEDGVTRNTANITYKLKNDEDTPDNPDPVDVDTHAIDLTKEFAGENTVISDSNIGEVKFTLAKKGADGAADTPLYGKEVTDGTNGRYYVVNTEITEAGEGYTDEFVCILNASGGNKGKLNIRGLANGTYVLTEISTIDGFSLLKDPVEVTIEDGTATITIVNEEKPIFELPLTGGSGTWIYTVGGMALIGAALFMVSKVGKKKTA